MPGTPSAGPSPAPGQGPLLHPAALAGALLLHLAAFGLLTLPALPRDPPGAVETTAFEFTLEAPSAPAGEAAPSEAAPDPAEAAEAPPPEPPPAEPPPPEPPPQRAAEVPPPPATPPRPAPPPRERRTRPAPPPTAAARGASGPATPAPNATANAAPSAPAGPPVFTQARFRSPPSPPDYPLVARERGITGTAIIRALVGASGETREVRLHRSSGHDSLDSAALAAVRRWSFEPSMRDGQRLDSWIEVPIRFQLR